VIRFATDSDLRSRTPAGGQAVSFDLGFIKVSFVRWSRSLTIRGLILFVCSRSASCARCAVCGLFAAGVSVRLRDMAGPVRTHQTTCSVSVKHGLPAACFSYDFVLHGLHSGPFIIIALAAIMMSSSAFSR
jgi:hypothetical protein